MGPLNSDEEARLVAAIAAAEEANRGEVAVQIDQSCVGDVDERAALVWEQFGFDALEEGSGVLLYVAVKQRQVRILAGPGIYGAQQPGYWQGVTDAVAAGFRDGDPAGGLEAALNQVGELLREAVPGEDTAGNELDDQVQQS